MRGKAGGGSRDRSTFAWIGLGAAILVAGAAVFMEIGSGEGGRERHDMFSSISPAPDGAKALYTLLGDLGYRTRRLLDPIAPGGLEGADVLVMIQPARPLSAEEREALVGWIAGGGTALIAGRIAEDPFAPSSADPLDPFVMHSPEAAGGAPAGAGTGGGTVPEAEAWAVEPSSLAGRLLEGVHRFAYVPLFMKREVEVAVEAGSRTWRRQRHEILVRKDGEAFVEVTAVKKGRVVKVARQDIVLNLSIRRADNLVFVLNVLDEWGGRGRVAFDEAHRSLMPGEQPSVWDVLGPASAAAFVQILIAAIAAMIAVGWRHAPALAETRDRRRRALQQVEALAGMLERARASRLAVRLLHRRTLHLWQSGRFLPPPGPRAPERARRQSERLRRLEAIARAAGSGRMEGRTAMARYIQIYGQLKRGESR